MHYLSPEEHQKAVARYLKNMDRTIEAMLKRRENEREYLAESEEQPALRQREPELA